MRVAHIGDIHIRGLARHDEYRRVFDELDEKLRLLKPDCIVNAGDIFHTKVSGITGEYIEFCSQWFTSLARIAPLRIILGNHDFNALNLTRIDAVSPIVNALDDPSIVLWKMSGVYAFAPGFNFCVYSIFDKDAWGSVRPVAGDCNVAIYHGPVNGCRTEEDWILSGDLSVSDFDEYDACLLSDIHRQQFLGYRAGKPWIGYSSSLIQQHFGETVDRHGFLLWTIDRGHADAEFHELTNPAPFLTIDWKGSTEATLDAAHLPKRFRLRVRSSQHISQRDAQTLTAALNARHDVLELVFKCDVQRTPASIVSIDGDRVLERTDLHDPGTLLKIIQTFHGGSTILTDANVALMLELIAGYVACLPSEEACMRNVKWSMRDLRFDNTFGYGDANRIDFARLSGIVGLFGQNRIGKSSIIGTILYALFNATDRGSIKNQHIINVRKQYCSAQVALNIGGVDHIIERITTKKEVKRGVYAPTSLNVFRINSDGEHDDLVGEQRTDTEKVIRGLIGTVDDFMLTSVSAQDEMNQFIRHGSTKRRQILSKFLDVDVFDRLHELANRDAQAVRAQLKGVPFASEERIAELTRAIDASHASMENVASSIDRATNEERVCADRVRELSSSGKVVTIEDIRVHEHRHERARAELAELKLRIAELSNIITQRREKLGKIAELSDANGVEQLKLAIDAAREKRTALLGLQHRLDREANLRDQQKRSLKILDEVPCGDMFHGCKFIREAHLNKEKLPVQEGVVDELIEQVDALSSEIDGLRQDELEDRLRKIEKLGELRAKLAMELVKHEHEQARAVERIAVVEKEIAASSAALADVRASFDADAGDALDALKQRLQVIRATLRSLDAERLKASTELGRLESQLDHQRSALTARNELLERLKVHDLITAAFSKKGLPSNIIALQLPIVNDAIATMLQGVVNFTVQLEIDQDTEFLEVYIDYGDSRRIIELGSGMEKMIASLAIRVALIQVSTLPKSDMLIIDEGFGALDDAGVEACGRLLTALKEHFRLILIVTHVDGLKSVADVTIDISKEGTDSRVIHENSR